MSDLRRSRVPFGRGLGALGVFLCAVGGSVEAAAKKPVQPARRPPSRIVLPPDAPPLISIWGTRKEYVPPQQRLSRFITALQQGHRLRAVQFLSTRVSAPERQALLEKRWLRQTPGDNPGFEDLLFEKDLALRPKGAMQGNRITLLVTPRTIPYNPKKRMRSKVRIGVMEVPMRKEFGDWRVDLHSRT